MVMIARAKARSDDASAVMSIELSSGSALYFSPTSTQGRCAALSPFDGVSILVVVASVVEKPRTICASSGSILEMIEL